MDQDRAKALRQEQTDAEHKLWQAVRTFRAAGFHFRRQAPFETYVLDLVCHRHRLVIEVDGGHHGDDPKQVTHDQKRTAFLESRGYRVLRFWNYDVLTQTAGVSETIYAALVEQHQRLGLYGPPPSDGRKTRANRALRRLNSSR